MKERIKLFSGKSRIRLFGDIAGSGPIPEAIPDTPKPQEDRHILVCQDCGFQIEDPGVGSTSERCPVCGGSRFNYLESMTNPGNPVHQEPITETDKAFSELKRQRISLFSKPEKKERMSLFSALTHRQPNTDGEGTDNGTTPESTFKCTDCGHTWNLQCDTTSGTRCPNCGGNRVVKVTQSDSDTTGEFLSRVAGQTLGLDEATKVFSECGAPGTLQDLIDSGYAIMTEDSEVSFSDTVESEYSLFSGLVISVTKELELPEIPQDQQREDLISSLSSLSPKGVLLIKRAHQVVPHPSDTGIVTGLSDKEKANLGQDGNVMTLQEFLDYIRLKYNDAPENLNDILCKNGIVKISDGQIAKTTN